MSSISSIGAFRVTSVVSDDQSSVVYHAHDPRRGIDVTIKKLLLGRPIDAGVFRRFARDIQILSTLNHCNIARPLEVGVCDADGAVYIVSELLRGRTLRQALSGPWPAKQTTNCACELAHGLAAAHAHDIVHGGLKPETVFLASDGHVKLLDFGVQQLIEAAPPKAPAGTMLSPDATLRLALGVVDYMSPEQVRGEEIDRRSDIFSLGAVLYEMVSGDRPFKGSSPQDIMGAIHRQEAKAPPALTGTIQRCLQKDPAARFQDAQQLTVALAGPGTLDTVDASPTLGSSSDRHLDTLGAIQYKVLRRFWPSDPVAMMSAAAYDQKSKLDVLLGSALGDLRGRTVIDFGCGYGIEAIDLARRGAARVIGLDSNSHYLKIGRRCVAAAGLSGVIELAERTSQRADVIVCLDSFEHFAEPDAILETMYGLLVPEGEVVISFGPTWYHPLGGHLFSVFPWAHLIFSEAALMRWRQDRRRQPGVDRFEQAGLNQMTIRRFEHMIERGPFKLELLEAVPIKRLKPFHNRLTREFTTSIVRCRLRRPHVRVGLAAVQSGTN